MKHRYLYLFLFLLLLGGIGVTTVAFYRYYAPPTIQKPYLIAQHHDDTLRIAYIGDSWVATHKNYDDRMATMMKDSLKRPVKVQSYGICGLTSKEIYEHLFNDKKMKVFMEQGYDYCFISAGINDTYKKMSTDYYQHSMEGIIRFLLANQIHPIIQEIPEYDIQKCYDWQTSSRKALRHLSMFINSTYIDCKQTFRDTLNKLINQKGYHDKVSIIRYKSWNNDYRNDLERLYMNDGMHLNSLGYAKLDSVIAREITIQLINNGYK